MSLVFLVSGLGERVKLVWQPLATFCLVLVNRRFSDNARHMRHFKEKWLESEE